MAKKSNIVKVIVGIGIPGSGKTSVLKNFADKYKYDYVCPDDIRFELTGDAGDQSRNGDVWPIANSRLAESLDAGRTVVLDATSAKLVDRKKLIRLAREHGVDKIFGVYVDTPLEVAKERNLDKIRDRVVPEHIIDDMYQNLENNPPSPEEGIDMIVTLDEFHRLVSAEKMSTEGDEIYHRDFGPVS